MHPRIMADDWDDDEDDEKPISLSRTPAFSVPTTQVMDDDDEPLVLHAPVSAVPVATANHNDDDEDDEMPLATSRRPPNPPISYPPAPPRTEAYSSIVYEQDDAHKALPRESPKRLCSSGDQEHPPAELLVRETTTSSSLEVGPPPPPPPLPPQAQEGPTTMRVEIGQWRDEATGKVVEPLPMPRVIQRPAAASASTWNSADQLIMCQSPLIPGPHSPKCPCIECIERRAYERGKAEGTVRTQFVHLYATPADHHLHDPHGPPMPDGTYHGEPSFIGGIHDMNDYAERVPGPEPTHIPAAVFQKPVPMPSPPAREPATRRRKQSQKKPEQSNTTNDDGDDDDDDDDDKTEKKKEEKNKQKPKRRPRPRSAKDPATQDRRDERDEMAASREAYEASVPAAVREATAYAQEDATTDRWLKAIDVRPPKEDRKDKKMRLAFRARLRAPYDMDRIRAGINALFNAIPANEPKLTRSRDAWPAFLVDVMCHDMVPATGSSEACGMRGFDKSMKTRPCTERMTKPAEGKRKMCNAHSLTLKAIRALVMATVGTARMLGLPRDDGLVSMVFDALAEIVHWFAATAIYSSRAFSTVELYVCTRCLVSALVEANRDKALSILSTRAT